MTDLGNAVANLQTIATANGKTSAITEQARSWANYPPGFCTPFPSCEPCPTYRQILHMRNLTLQKSQPAILLYYSLFDIQTSDNPKRHWADEARAAFAKDFSIPDTPASH